MDYDKYEILYGLSMTNLEGVVNEYLKAGWICQGGVSSSPVYSDKEFMYQIHMQAVVKPLSRKSSPEK